MLAERPVKPDYRAEQPAATQDQEQAADHQEAFVERPGWPTQQVGILLLLQFLDGTRKSQEQQRRHNEHGSSRSHVDAAN